MPLSRDQAQDALRDIDQTQRRSATAYSYRMASPHLIWWGLIWLFGYGAAAAHWNWDPLWLILSLVGSAGSFGLGWQASRTQHRKFDGRIAATFVAVIAFVTSVIAIMRPTEGTQFAAFFPILVALYYALIGIWTRGMRMLLTGIALAAFTLFGFFEMRGVFDLWMTVVGGGGLILGGIWLRSV